VTGLRQLLDLKSGSSSSPRRMIIIPRYADKLLLAEKLLRDIDKAQRLRLWVSRGAGGAHGPSSGPVYPSWAKSHHCDQPERERQPLLRGVTPSTTAGSSNQLRNLMEARTPLPFEA